MAWTYTNDPTNVARDEVRLLIGDVDSSSPQLTDEEISYYLTREGNATGAAAAAASGLAALYSKKADKAVSDLRISYGQIARHYQALAASLSRRLAIRGAKPIAGGISRARKETVDDDTDQVEPHFKRDQFRHPGADDDDLIRNN